MPSKEDGMKPRLTYPALLSGLLLIVGGCSGGKAAAPPPPPEVEVATVV
jgi:hypothetical protein